MRNWRGWVGLVAMVLGGCPAAPVGAGGVGGNAGSGGASGTAGAAGTAGVSGIGGVSGVGGAGYGGVGGIGGAGYGGVGGFGGVSGVGGEAGTIAPDGGTCVPGMRCGPEGPDSNDCGTLTLNAEVEETVTPGNLLVIFDRSGSMEEPWGTLGPKWVVAKDALANALTPVADRLTVGAVLFPTVGCIVVAGSVAPITDPSQINFMPGTQFIPRWNTYWMNNTLQPGTPVALAFDAAAASLAGANLTGTTAVVLFTDGEPTDVGLCPAFQMASADRAAQFLAMGIKTYVVGLPGANGVQVLRDIAVAGGTMDYITPDDPAVLSQRIASIATSTISVGFDSCSITLNPPAEAPDDLQLVVTENGMELGVDRNLGNGGGWSITPDGAQVEITGQLCEEMKSGRFSSIKFKFGCVNLPPLPPPMPPD